MTRDDQGDHTAQRRLSGPVPSSKKITARRNPYFEK
jgi:hypothetical protein